MIQTLPSLVRVRGRFHRSVQINRDWESSGELGDYLVTPTVRSLTHWVLDELGRDKGTRAWSVTGPYGTGKSAFALFLSKLLAGQLTKHPEFESFKKHLPKRFKPFVAATVVGQRAGLRQALLHRLSEAMAAVDPAMSKAIKRSAKTSHPTDTEVVEAFERSARAAKDSGYGGLLVVVDEFGKFLEHIATASDDSDLQVMQQLAEVAARSTVPLLVITILHSSFTSYAGDDELQQAEWQKVQGRFQDVAFQEPHEQLLRLIGAAIEKDLEPTLLARYNEAADRSIRSSALSESRDRLPLHELLPDCMPLEPVAAVVLAPLFRSKLAQNERSLFSFLTSQEPFGFQEFIEQADWEADSPPLYRLDQLYDYVTFTLGPSLYQGTTGRRWAEIEAAIDRIRADAPPITRSLVKALGLLWIHGKAVGLKADAETLKLAIGEVEVVHDALEYLERSSIIVYRRFEGAYGLWEGSDVDLSERYKVASQQISQGNLANRLEKQIDLRPLVARAHYIKSGTLRYFAINVLDSSEVTLSEALGNLEAGAEADGRIIFFLTHDHAVRDRLIKKSEEITSQDSPLTLLAFPRPLEGLEAAIIQVETWRSIEPNTPELAGDKAAKTELEANLRAAQEHLEAIAGRVFGLRGHRFEPAASEWVQGGKTHHPTDGLAFQRWLSRLCDQVFDKAPQIKNELLNRKKLSSAAKAGLNELIEKMVFSERSYRFGIGGTPAEVSMYESFIREGGFHHQDHGWKICPPHSPAWQAVWNAVEDFLESTHKGRRPLIELYDRLKAPPFGLRDGPLPLFLMVALLSKPNEIALYREGLFQVGLNKELLMLVTHNPESFEIQQFAFTSEGRKTLEVIQKVVSGLGVSVKPRGGSPLLRIAEPLLVSIAQLPDFAKKTRRLSPPEAVDLRETLLKATDPHELLLEKIPQLLGLSLKDPNLERLLAERLHDCLVALYQAYPRLLDQIESQFKATFNLTGKTTEALRVELRKRTEAVSGLASNSDLSRFVNAASGLGDQDWREVVGRVVMSGKPPNVWLDSEVVDFQVRLQHLYSDFVRLEELGLEKQRSGANKVIRVGVLESKLKEVRESIPVSSDQLPEVAALSQRLSKVLEKSEAKSSRQVRLAALAQLLQQEIERR